MAPEERRQAIIDAVVPLLVVQSAELTTRQIAEAAGIAEGTIFRVFPDKRALIQAAAEAVLGAPWGDTGGPGVDPGRDLHDMVRTLAAAMFEGHDRVMAALLALRALGECPGPGQVAQRHAGPPPIVVSAQEALLERLTAHFDHYRDQLAVEPRQAALVLRALVMGARHPGFGGDQLTVDGIADAVVSGVARTPTTPRKGRR